jgi:hypothetical protein
MANKRLESLLKLFSPSAIVVKKERWTEHKRAPILSLSSNVLTRVASAHSLPIFLINREKVRKTFRNMGCETRDEIAAALARIFPELVWRLSPKRRAWQSEHPRMAIFDAVALGLVYGQYHSTTLPIPPNGN